MVDLQIVFPQDLVPVTSVTLASRAPPMIRVVGRDFRSVDEVLINDVPSPLVTITGPRTLLARVPEDTRLSSVSVVVTSRTLTLTESSRLRFRISRVPSKTSGILRLVQLFMKIFFTTPGTDIFNKTLGGGALRIVGAAGSRSSNELVGDVIVAVANTQRQILSIQGRQPQIPADERLLAASVISSRFRHADASLLVSIQLTNQTGRSALANLVA